jgi:prepilin-type N-terminal cleavage/methylation domain-containing protein
MTDQRRTMPSPRRVPAGFTLIELIVSLVIMSILLGSMASAVILAGHALPDGDDPLDRTALAVAAVDRIARDLALADPLIAADSNEVRFYVPDRGHGAAGPEKIIYAWSGVTGDPLTYTYNSGSAVTVCENVYDLSLEYIREAKPLLDAPRVLLVVSDAGALSLQEQARQTLMESWGFTIQPVGGDASQIVFDTLIGDSNVLYVCGTVSSTAMADKDFNPPIGVVNEAGALYDEFGFAEGADTSLSADYVWIVDETHEITAGLGTGQAVIYDAAQQHVCTAGTLAPGAEVITNMSGAHPTTVVVDTGGLLYGGGRALRRRVGLVWGTSAFDLDLVNNLGRRYLRQAIAWAAAPAGIGTVRITLQIGSDLEDRVETEVQLLNKPEEP